MLLCQQRLVDLEIQQNATGETESKFHAKLSAWQQRAADYHREKSEEDSHQYASLTISVTEFMVVIFAHFMCTFAVIYNRSYCRHEVSNMMWPAQVAT
jgi:hypothetical protein